MPKTREKYMVAGVDLYHVRNRNEQRVVQCLAELVDKNPGYDLTPEDIKDTYAFALNQLPSRYTQQGTIVLRDPVRKEEIAEIVADAFDHVIKNPKKS